MILLLYAATWKRLVVAQHDILVQTRNQRGNAGNEMEQGLRTRTSQIAERRSDGPILLRRSWRCKNGAFNIDVVAIDWAIGSLIDTMSNLHFDDLGSICRCESVERTKIVLVDSAEDFVHRVDSQGECIVEHRRAF